MMNYRFKGPLLICLSMFLFFLGGCGKKPQAVEPQQQADLESNLEQSGQLETAEPVPLEEQEHVTRLKFAAIGDVLIHSSIYKDAKTEDGYQFQHMFEPIKAYIEEADIASANQESMIGGTEIGLSDYPRFNSPFEVGDALKHIGIDIVTMANNHTLDRGEQAIMNAINHWKKLGVKYTGAYASEEDRQRIRTITKNGITMAFLSYTYGTNGIPIPKGKPYLVNLIDQDQVVIDIAAAKKVSDLVVVNVHFGQEYVRLPNEQQKQFARYAAEAGAQIIVGHHPHVLQPVEWIETSAGNRAFVIYSLGNFIAAQSDKYKQTGGIIKLEVEKRTKGDESEITLHSPSFIPTWISMTNWRNFKVIPLRELSENQLAKPEEHLKEIQKHMSQWMPELEFP